MSRPSQHVPASILKAQSKKGIEPTPAPEKPEIDIPAPPEKDRGDIRELARTVIRLKAQAERIQLRRDELSERLELSEKVSLQKLRNFSETGEGDAAVDKARDAEAQARKQLVLNTDSLGLVKNDLATAQDAYDVAQQAQSARHLRFTKQTRMDDEPRFESMVKRGMLELLVNLELGGLPIGQVDLGKVLKKRWPSYRQDVIDEVDRIRCIVSHSLESEQLKMEAENEQNLSE